MNAVRGAAPFTEHLDLAGPDRTGGGDAVAVVLVHNEANLLVPFFKHYRRFGPITFVAVDDRSTDGSGDWLAAQPDVTLLRPRDGSTYAADKREWRGQVLDRVAGGGSRWVLAPDVDELLTWHGAPERSFGSLLATLDREGAAALLAVMVDMYRDAPIAEHVYREGDLLAAFPLYDDPARSGGTTWAERAPRRMRARWPAPEITVLGGMRHRLFGAGRPGPLRTLRRGLPRHDPGPAGLLREAALRPFVRQRGTRLPAVNLTKVPLVRWRHGLRFFGGAHALNAPLRLASERGALLHYPITRGLDGIRHLAARGQHAGGAAHYRAMVDAGAINPVFAGTARRDGGCDLSGILLPPRRAE